MSLIATELYPIQERGRQFLVSRKRAVLSLPVGRGKTLASLAAIDSLGLDSCIVFCNKNAVLSWEETIVRHTQFDISMYPDFEVARGIVTIVPLSRVAQLIKAKGLGVFCSSPIIVDEIDLIANPQTTLYESLKRLLRLNKSYVWGLTATPYHSKVLKVFNYLGLICSPNPLGRYYQFAKEYMVFKERKIRIGGILRTINEFIGVKNKEKLVAKLKNLIYQDPVDIDIRTAFLWEDLDSDESRTYLEMAQTLFKENSPSGLYHLLQILVDTLEDGSKIQLLRTVLLDMKERGKPFILYCSYKESLRTVKDELLGTDILVSVITGETSLSDRKEIYEGVREEVCECILMTHAGIRSCNLQKCESVILYDIPVDISMFLQLMGRVTRIGSPYDTFFVFVLGIRNTIDEYKSQYLEANASLLKDLIGGKGFLPLSGNTVTKEDVIKMRKKLLWKK